MVHHDEISVVDLVLIFYKRRYYFLGSFAFFVIMSSVFIYRSSNIDTYVSVIKVSSLNNEPISKAKHLITDLNTDFYYEFVSQAKLKKLMSQTSYSSLGESVVRIETKGSDSKEIKKFHEMVLDYLIAQDSVNFEKEIKRLKERVAGIEAIKARGSGSERHDIEIRELLTELESAKSSSVLLKAESRKTIEGSGNNKLIIVSVLFSFIMGIVTVFLSELIHSVRGALRERLKDLS